MKRTITSNKRLYALFSQLGIDNDSKCDLVLSISNGRTVHSSELTESEARQLIEKLQPSGSIVPERRWSELAQQLRRNVFKLMYDIGLLNSNMNTAEKLDFINNWIKNKNNLDKDFNALNFDELTTFIKQLQAIRRNYIEKKAKQAMFN
jgi:hypothetical protein